MYQDRRIDADTRFSAFIFDECVWNGRWLLLTQSVLKIAMDNYSGPYLWILGWVIASTSGLISTFGPLKNKFQNQIMILFCFTTKYLSIHL